MNVPERAPARFRTMADFWEYVARYTDYEKRTDYRADRKTFDLDRMRRLADRLGSPQHTFASVHIAGTNGKGSTAHALAAILGAAGLRVGLYTSPHLVDVRERIRVNAKPLPESEWLERWERLHEPFENDPGGEHPTFFEMVTALAFDAFRDHAVDIAVLEVGLGGRLDATNIVLPEAVAITEIAIDHAAQLGNTLTEIAAEKAAIIKEGVPVLVSAQAPAAMEVIERAAGERNAPLYRLGSEIELSPFEIVPERGTVFHVKTWLRGYSLLELPIPAGSYLRSAALAIGLAEVLKERAFVNFGSAQLRPALAGLSIPGRAQVVESSPLVLLDGAHNPAAAAALFAGLAEYFPARQPVALVGLLADKDAAGFLSAIARAKRFHVTAVESPRSRDAGDLARLAGALTDRPVETGPDALAVFDRAKSQIREGEMLVVTGSFYLVGQILRDRYPDLAR